MLTSRLFFRFFLPLVFLSLSCGEDQNSQVVDMGTDLDMDMAVDAPVTHSVCASYTQVESCDADGCELSDCRGDEVCEAGRCIDWTTANLTVDFTLEQDPVDPMTFSVEVAEDGFPRHHVDALRFDFGDGIAGWGESLKHTYLTRGVYPVTLEVRLDGHRILTKRKLAVVDPTPEHNPLFLTVNDIPTLLNGSLPAQLDDGILQPFHLQVPHDGFHINVALLEDPKDPIDPLTLSLGAVVEGVRIDLSDSIEWEAPEHTPYGRGRVVVGPANPMPFGLATLEFKAQTQSGASVEQLLTVETTPLAGRDPFDRPMVWLFRDDTDFFTISRTKIAGSRYSINATDAPDTLSDFHEELRQTGILGEDEALNQVILGWIRHGIRKEVYRFFGIGPDGLAHDNIAMKIVWTGEEDAPDPSTFDPAKEFSMMRLGGVFNGFLGYSKYSAHNQERVDDSTRDLGVASAGVLSALTSTIGVSDAFKTVNPDVGIVLGQHPSDSRVLDPEFDRWGDVAAEDLQRYEDLRFVVQSIALALAPVIAHEMGHAMGLMPDGLPPQGFFGNRPDVHFVGPRTNSHHTDLPGLNLMQAGGDTLALLQELDSVIERKPMSLIEIATLLSLETQLSPLSRAYLQRRLTYIGDE